MLSLIIMKLKLVFLVLVSFYLLPKAQDLTDPVQSIWEVVDKNIELNYVNSDYCDYFLVSSRNKEVRIRPGKNTLVRIPKERYSASDPEFFPSSYQLFKGYFPKKLNPDFKYALPVKPGDSTYFMVNPKKSTMTYLFKVPELDTIYAVRGGIVCKNNNKGLVAKGENVESRGDILIYHYDQTMAHYGMLSETFVNEGEIVTVGMPVGTASNRTFFSLSFFYLDRNKFKGASSIGLPHTYFNPVFHTTVGDTRLVEKKCYTSQLNDSVITQEMTKGELKRYMKKKQKAGAR